MDAIEHELKTLYEQVHQSVGTSPSPPFRRVRLERFGMASIAVTVVASLSLAVPSLVQSDNVRQRPASGSRWVSVATVEQAQRKQVIYVKKEQAFVVATDAGFVALSALSPHPGTDEAGHRVLFCARSQMFEGAHGEKFDRVGRYVAGPAPRGMDHVRVRAQQGRVEIAPDEISTGLGRDAEQPLEPAGPPCDAGGSPVERRPGFAAPEKT